jgi:TetR/AcrR family transcriptional repressor of nem operon
LREYLCNPEIAPLVRLRGWFDHRIEALTASDYARGCLLGNFSAEAADHSASIREHVAHEFSAWSSVIADCLSEAQRQGAIGNQFPSALLADFILTSWEGALLRMRAEKSVAPLVDFKTFIFAKSLG